MIGPSKLRGIGAAVAAMASGTALLVGGPAGAQAATPTGPATTSTPSTSATATAAPSPGAARCDSQPWGVRVQGTPTTFDAGDRGGDYLWHDSRGFHLRVTHKGDDRAVYSGVLRSADPMWIDPVRLEGNDFVALSADSRTLTFRFVDYGHIDGVDFHAGCSPWLAVTDLRVAADRLPADRVSLGADERHPRQVPFAVHRTA